MEYDAYTPALDNNFYPGWDIVNDSHSVTDFIWQFRTKPSTNQITETIEHLLHSITNFDLIGPYPSEFNVKTPSGPVWNALQEAISNGAYDRSDYDHLPDNNDGHAAVMTEYLYCLIYAEWSFIPKYVDGGSLAPEWSDDALTKESIASNNPLGHFLYENYIKKVIAKPNEQTLELIFQDNNKGISSYITDNDSALITGNEGNDVLNSGNGDDTIEGGSFKSAGAASSDTAGVHRFFNTQLGTHFFTPSEGERDSVIENLPVYNYEGIAYYVDAII